MESSINREGWVFGDFHRDYRGMMVFFNHALAALSVARGVEATLFSALGDVEDDDWSNQGGVMSARTARAVCSIDASKVLCEFALWNVRQVLSVLDHPDPLLVASLDTIERWLDGQATDEERVVAARVALDVRSEIDRAAADLPTSNTSKDAAASSALSALWDVADILSFFARPSADMSLFAAQAASVEAVEGIWSAFHAAMMNALGTDVVSEEDYNSSLDIANIAAAIFESRQRDAFERMLRGEIGIS